MTQTTPAADHAADLQRLTAAATAAAAHPFVPGPVRELLPVLVRVMQRQAQELAELRRPPCEGCTKRLPVGEVFEGWLAELRRPPCEGC